jgi:pimeloyl-ACP methyl ester carboxylesterase
VDVIGAALGSLVGALLAIRHSKSVRRFIMCAVAPDMAGPTRAYVAERAEKVRVLGMLAVAEASLANSFPTSYPDSGPRIARSISARPGGVCRTVTGTGPVGNDGGRLRSDPSTHSRRLRRARFPMTAGDRPAGRRCAKFVTIEDAGHFPHLQAPETLMGLARPFLDSPV